MTTLASAENAKQHPGKAASMSEGYKKKHMCQSDQSNTVPEASAQENLTEGRSTASGPGERLRQSMPSSSSESIASVFVQITDTAFEGITHV